MDVIDLLDLPGQPVRMRLVTELPDDRVAFRRGVLVSATDAGIVIDGYRDCCTEHGSPEISYDGKMIGWDDLAEIRIWHE